MATPRRSMHRAVPPATSAIDGNDDPVEDRRERVDESDQTREPRGKRARREARSGPSGAARPGPSDVDDLPEVRDEVGDQPVTPVRTCDRIPGTSACNVMAGTMSRPSAS